jgi:hypothetical protein
MPRGSAPALFALFKISIIALEDIRLDIIFPRPAGTHPNLQQISR